MPRDASGNYSLPTGNPVTPGTVIEAAWANTTMPDLGLAMTDSLSRTGKGGMLVPFRNADGNVAAPGITWTNEPTSGWYRKATQDFWYSVGNEDIFNIKKIGVALAPGKTLTVDDFSAANINATVSLTLGGKPVATVDDAIAYAIALG